MQYKRILLKLSGEALMGNRQYGIDPDRLKEYAEDIKQLTKKIYILFEFIIKFYSRLI